MEIQDLQGKVVYITGGSKGIGFGIAMVLGKAGMKVAISGRNENTLNTAFNQLQKENVDVYSIISDVNNYADEVSAIRQITEKWGGIDVVIANAGVGCFANVMDLTIEDWNQMIGTNLNGPFYTLKASVKELIKSEGYFITIASLAGINFFAKGAGYNASKFGLVGFTQAAMLDLRSSNVKVTCIMPGSVSSNFNGNEPTESDFWKIQPMDIGKLVLDLLKMHPRTLPSKIEVRPTRPDLKGS